MIMRDKNKEFVRRVGGVVDTGRRSSSSSRIRMLITVTVSGSPGPLRFVVNEDDTVASVIKRSLRSYAREGRLPIPSGSDINEFVLLCVNYDEDQLKPSETIGSHGTRNFVLYKKKQATAENQPQTQNQGSSYFILAIVVLLNFIAFGITTQNCFYMWESLLLLQLKYILVTSALGLENILT